MRETQLFSPMPCLLLGETQQVFTLFFFFPASGTLQVFHADIDTSICFAAGRDTAGLPHSLLLMETLRVFHTLCCWRRHCRSSTLFAAGEDTAGLPHSFMLMETLQVFHMLCCWRSHYRSPTCFAAGGDTAGLPQALLLVETLQVFHTLCCW